MDRGIPLPCTQVGHLVKVHPGQFWPSRQVSSLKTTTLRTAQPTGLLQESHLIVTVTVVAFQLKSYDLLPKQVPKGLEFGSVVHVLCVHAGGPDITHKGKLFTLI